MDKNLEDNEFLGNDYTLWRKDKKHGGGGVLLAAVNNSKRLS